MDKEYLIKQNPLKALIIFAIPMVIGNLFQQLYNMADSVIVGRYVSENALAAVGASYALTNVFICVAIGGGVGASVITSQTFGAKDYRRMIRSVSTALISFLVISTVLAGFGMVFSPDILRALNTPESVLADAVTYLKIYFLGLPFLFMYNVLSAMFNALGKSSIPLGLLIFSSVFNVILDIILVRNFHLGVAGVAFATLIAQGISAVISFMILLRVLCRYSGERMKWTFDLQELLNMSRIAIPSILQQSTVSIGMMLVQSVVNSFGAQMLAGYSAAMRVESVCIVPMSAMGNAMSSYVAQNLGAGEKKRAVEGYHASYIIIAVTALFLIAATQLSAEPAMRLFLKDSGSAAAMQTGVACIRFTGLFYIMIGLKMSTDGLLRGSGDMTVFTIATLANLSIRVIVAVTMAPRFGIQFVWYAVPMGWTVSYILSFTEYRTGKWQTLKG